MEEQLIQELHDYLDNRWNLLPEKAKRLLGAYDHTVKMHIETFWTKQFYIEKLREFGTDIAGNKR